MVRRCWVNFQCRGILSLISVGQGPIMLAVGAGGGLFGHLFSHLSLLFSSPSLWETARYTLKYRLKGPLNPKQPTNQPTQIDAAYFKCCNSSEVFKVDGSGWRLDEIVLVEQTVLKNNPYFLKGPLSPKLTTYLPISWAGLDQLSG